MLNLNEIAKEVIENGEWTIWDDQNSKVSYGNIVIQYIPSAKRLQIRKQDAELILDADYLMESYCYYKNKAVEQKCYNLVLEFNEELEKAKRKN